MKLMQYLYLYSFGSGEITNTPPTEEQLQDAQTPDGLRIVRGEFGDIEEFCWGNQWDKVGKP